MVLTSPPYFNLEVYTAGLQSINEFPTWEVWTEKWLKPVILSSLAALKPGGVSCWSVKNFKSDKQYPLADVTKQIHEAAGWTLVKTVTMTGSARPGGKRINQETGKEKRGSEEETFCYQKL
jgi:DNA modification methylase